MLILNQEEYDSLMELNDKNIHLHRALRPVKLADDSSRRYFTG